jgi:YHS domain-containing protein
MKKKHLKYFIFLAAASISFAIFAYNTTVNSKTVNSIHKATSHRMSGNKNIIVAGDKKNGFPKMPKAGTKALCPVMKKEFTVKSSSPNSVYEGKTWVFCCSSCKTAFDKNPKKYAK